MSTPLVSVMMAVYNSEKYLREAIEGILNQTYTNFEFLIINDGSTDKSKDIILSYSDPRIVFLENEINSGIVKSRNTCLEKSKGKYIAILDSDDIALPIRLEKQVEFMEFNPEYGMCGTYFKVINNKGKKLYNVKFPISDFDLKSYLHFGNSFCHSTMLIRSDLALKFKYPEAFQLGEDYALWQSISSVSKIYTIPVFTTYYRIHGNNISVSKQAEMFEAIKIINATNLQNLSIPFSENELEIYSHFLIFNHEYFKNKDNFKKLEEWLQKLLSYVEKDKEIEKIVILRFLLQRWFVICYKINRYQYMFFNKLFFSETKSYLQYLSQFLFAQYKKIFFI